MTDSTSTLTLRWLQSHKEAIRGLATRFIRCALNPDCLFRTRNSEDSVFERMAWGADDQKQEVVIGCILAFQSCGRNCPVADLVRVVNMQTESTAGVEPVSVVEELNQTGIITVEIDAVTDLKEQYVELQKEALEVLTGLKSTPHQDGSPGAIQTPAVLKEVPIPIQLLKLGAALKRIADSNSPFDRRSFRSRLNCHEEDSPIEEASKVLADRLSDLDFIAGRLKGKPLDELDAKILALLFAAETTGSTVNLQDLTTMGGSNLNSRLEVLRRVRKGSLVQSGIVVCLRGSHFEIETQIVDSLLELSVEETGKPHNLAITIFENRVKANLPRPAQEQIEDEPGGEFVPSPN